MAKFQYVQPAHTGAGVAAGVGEIDASNASYTGTVVITGGANITVSTAVGNKVVIVGGAGGAGGSFSAGLSNLGNTSGTSGTVSNQLVLAGGNNVTLSQSTDAGGATVTISGVNTVAQSVQTQNLVDLTLSGNTSGVMALVSSGTATLAGGNNITLSQAGNAITISGPNTVAQSAQTGISGVVASDSTYSSGSVIISGENNITVHSSTAAAGVQKVLISGPNTSAQQTAISGIVGSNATYTSGTVSFTGVGGGITVSSNTGQRIDLSVAAPVAQTGTQFSAGISGGNTSGDTGTVAGRVVFAGGNNITLSGSTNGVSETITISGPAAGGAQTAISGIVASDSTYTSGTVIFSGENNVTVHSSTAGAGVQKVLISGPNTSAQQTGISGLAGSNTTYTSGTVSLTGVGGGVTVSSNTGQRIDISVAAQTAQTQSNIQGIAASNTTYNTGTVSFTGVGGGITVSSNTGQRVDLSVAAPVTNSVWFEPGGMAGFYAHTQGTLWCQPVPISNWLTATRAELAFSVGPNTASTAGISAYVALYTRNVSTLSTVSTGSMSSSWTSGSNNNTNWGGVSLNVGVSVPLNVNASPGDYWAVVNLISTNAGTWNWRGINAIGHGGPIGSISNGSFQQIPFEGRLSVGTASFPATLASTDISGGNAVAAHQAHKFLMFRNV